MSALGDAFLIQCRQNYLEGLTPLNVQLADAGYLRLATIARQYLAEGKQTEFSWFMMEGQYYVHLWSALFLLKFFQPDEPLRSYCLEEIRQHFGTANQPWPAS